MNVINWAGETKIFIFYKVKPIIITMYLSKSNKIKQCFLTSKISVKCPIAKMWIIFKPYYTKFSIKADQDYVETYVGSLRDHWMLPSAA